MITADQLVAHLVGDYVLQSDWMAQRKRTEATAALLHAFFYTLPFLVFLPSASALALILWSHFLIDRFGLARYVVWAKNWIAPPWLAIDVPSVPPEYGNVCRRAYVRNLPWADCTRTGYPSPFVAAPETAGAVLPPFLAVWLLIIADNVLHILINGAALRWL